MNPCSLAVVLYLNMACDYNYGGCFGEKTLVSLLWTPPLPNMRKHLNPTALRKAKIVYHFDLPECNRAEAKAYCTSFCTFCLLRNSLETSYALTRL